MPDIYGGVRQRGAAFGIHQGNAQSKRHTRLAFGDIGPDIEVVNIIRSDFLFRSEATGGSVPKSSKTSQRRSARASNEPPTRQWKDFGDISRHFYPYRTAIAVLTIVKQC